MNKVLPHVTVYAFFDARFLNLRQRFIYLLILLFLLLGSGQAIAQQPDSIPAAPDSLSTALRDSIPPAADTTKKNILTSIHNPWMQVIDSNNRLNAKASPVSRIESLRKPDSRDAAFYFLAFLLLVLGLLKLAYSRYFSNLVRVFFNTSLRQSQLTDQLLQAKLPSLLFNLFFILIGGYYIFLLMAIFGKITFGDWPVVLPICIIALLLIYLVKYWVLKFAGWITGHRAQTETYIFIVFLVNKMIALALVPLVIVMSFSQQGLVQVALILSFVVIGSMLLMRFFRSYGLLQHGIRVSRFHFFLYIIGIEVLPLLLIYQSAMIFISKNL